MLKKETLEQLNTLPEADSVYCLENVQLFETMYGKNLISKLKFNVYAANGELPYKAGSFDVVYSKGVLNHVSDKDKLFRQVNTLLKPTGLFVITDWIFPKVTVNNLGPLVCETKKSYEQVLKNTGFSEIEFRDDSKMFLSHVKVLLENLTKHQVFLECVYGKEIFSIVWKQHQELTEEINHKRKYAVRILANKKITD